MQRRFVDIHCHILPELDDGAASLHDALEMAAMASADGTAIIVATPHADHRYEPLPADELLAKVDEFNSELARRSIPLCVLPGADVHIDASLPRKIQERQIMTLGDTGKYLLLELPHEIYVPFQELMFDLDAVGITTILSHPERNRGIQADPEVLWPLVDQGCLMQVTAGSLLGEFGSEARKLSLRMIEHRLIHFIASDAHSPRRRNPLLQEAWRMVAKLTDRDYADQLFEHNPRAVIEGQPITVAAPLPFKRSFFSRLLGK